MFDNDFKLFESRAISRYLANKYQGTKNSTILIPKDLQKASLVEQFLSVENCKFDKPSSIIIHEENYANFHGKETNVERVKQEKEELEKVLDVYEKLLEGKEYLTGEYSLADLSHVPNIFFIVNKTSVKDVIYDSKRPNFVKWVKNISERPAWKRILTKIDL